MITHRQQVTDMIISAKVLKSIKWADVAKEIGLSKEWVTAACLGQMAFNKQQAEKIGQIFDLSDDINIVTVINLGMFFHNGMP